MGNNHEGSLGAAIEMLEKAVECGADLVKFQAGTAEGFARTPEDVPRYRKYEIGREGYDRLIQRGKELNVPVFFSVWSKEFSEYRQLEYFKIAARQCDANYIKHWAKDGTFISIPHMMPEHEIMALEIKKGLPMHCVEKYPAEKPLLNRMVRLAEMFDGIVGYSDHTIGIDACVQAWELGALAIEKHFTLRHDFGPLRDHIHAATPEEFKVMVQEIGEKIK